MDITKSAQQQVHDFNEAITAWFRGETAKENSNEVLGRLHQEFVMVAPDGSVKTYSDLAAWLPTVYGVKPGFQAVADEFIVSFSADNLVIIVYHEMQKSSSVINNRRSSALFITDEDGKITWRHLQETWII